MQAWIDADAKFACWFLLDGSPRMGKEWLLGEMWIMTFKQMEDLLQAHWAIMEMRDSGEWDSDKSIEYSAVMLASLWHHVLISVALGNGNADLGMKFLCVADILRIESTCWKSVCKWANSIFSITSDYGTEHQIGDCSVKANLLFPHWREDAIEDNSVVDMMDELQQIVDHSQVVGD